MLRAQFTAMRSEHNWQHSKFTQARPKSITNDMKCPLICQTPSKTRLTHSFNCARISHQQSTCIIATLYMTVVTCCWLAWTKKIALWATEFQKKTPLPEMQRQKVKPRIKETPRTCTAHTFTAATATYTTTSERNRLVSNRVTSVSIGLRFFKRFYEQPLWTIFWADFIWDPA